MGACGSKSAKKNFAGDGHSLQPKQQPQGATTAAAGESAGNPSPFVYSPGYRLSGAGGDPEKVTPVGQAGGGGAPTADANATLPPNTTDDIERQKRLEAIEKRADKLAGKEVKPRAFAARA